MLPVFDIHFKRTQIHLKWEFDSYYLTSRKPRYFLNCSSRNIWPPDCFSISWGWINKMLKWSNKKKIILWHRESPVGIVRQFNVSLCFAFFWAHTPTRLCSHRTWAKEQNECRAHDPTLTSVLFIEYIWWWGRFRSTNAGGARRE